MSLRRFASAVVVCAAALGAMVHSANAGCGGDPKPCQIAGGDYDLALPSNEDRADEIARFPAVVFLHGHGSSGAAVLRNKALVDGLLSRGYAVIAPTALPRWNGKRSWNFLPGREGRDEAQFLSDVVVDAADRTRVDLARVLLAGFSAGAFMVNYLACTHPTDFAAYAPVAGGFWDPIPEDCAGPVRLFHSHGWTDTVVPLEGRALGGPAFRQGDVFAGLALWRHANGCSFDAPTDQGMKGQALWRRWRCGAGADIVFSLTANGHVIPRDWASQVLDWFEAETD